MNNPIQYIRDTFNAAQSLRQDVQSRQREKQPEMISPVPREEKKIPRMVKAVEAKDNRIEKVVSFFKHYNSPLGSYAKQFVEYADKHNIDYRIAPVITILETSGGKNMKTGIKYNVGNVGIRSGWDYPSYDEAIRGLVSIIGGRTAPEFNEAQIRNASYYEPYRQTRTKENPVGDLEALAKIYEPENTDYPWNLKYNVEQFENF